MRDEQRVSTGDFALVSSNAKAGRFAVDDPASDNEMKISVSLQWCISLNYAWFVTVTILECILSEILGFDRHSASLSTENRFSNM